MPEPWMTCVAKGLEGMTKCQGLIDSEHIVNRGYRNSGGCDICKVNRAWLCRGHHDEAHFHKNGGKKFWYNQHPKLAEIYRLAWEHEYARRVRGSDLPCAPRR